ncbi:hypothetical protein GCM10025865_24920 [Paraoerskovia sediminicola]|uniref:Transglutaminase-like domain-containing protein n=1 Tax=Paraoerskovia sediminicola TaxID=1138587 RepID=A0ABN6XIR6_9CELL|nr:hypothetical protein GCM10025865_24920 [Paraoerskovia sediminicola]
MTVVHTTSFTYGVPVTASHNEARMTPCEGTHQRVLRSSVDIEHATWRSSYSDYWGTAVTEFEVLAPHEQMTITAESVVEVDAPDQDVDRSVGWERLGADEVLDEFAAELSETSATEVPDDVAALALGVAGGLDPFDAAEAICRAVRDELEYVPGVTTVHTPAVDAWAARTGVCQDMAHLCLGALRSVGIPARYVSGYLHSDADAPLGQTVVGESHAWIEWWTGAWFAFDPTNRVAVGDHHVVLGRGREYGDVPPLKGVFAGGAASDLSVSVRMTRTS